MPNWCENDFMAVGPKGDVEKFMSECFSSHVDEAAGKALDFDKAVPYPANFRDMDRAAREAREQGVPWDKAPKDGFNSGGYEWCVEHWGTKWPACHPRPITVTTLKDNKTSKITQSFDTAWSPPVPVIAALSERYPTITFKLRYFECGVGFSGHYQAKNGVTLKDDENTAYRGNRGG